MFTLKLLLLAAPTIKKNYRKNRHLANMVEPFDTHYFYYVLAERLSTSLLEMFGDSEKVFLNFATEEKIATGGKITISSELIQHKEEVVRNQWARELTDLLASFLGLRNLVNRPNLASWDLEKIKEWTHFKNCSRSSRKREGENWIITPEQVEKFWRKAKRCDKNLTGDDDEEDVNVPLMNLLAFFCGYGDFRDFILTEFGDHYSQEQDPILIRQYETYGYPIPGGLQEIKTLEVEEDSLEADPPLSSIESTPTSQVSKPGTIRKFLPLVFLFLTGIAAVFYLMGRVGQAEVRMNLTTDYIHFETHEAVTLRSSEKNLLSSTDHFYIRNGVYSLGYPFSESSPGPLKIAVLQSEPVGIGHLKLTARTGITIETPTKNDVYFDFSEPLGLEGYIFLRNLEAFSPSEDTSVTYHETPLGTGINFQSAKNQNLGISLIRAGEFELPPLLVNSLGFGQPGQKRVEYGILSGQIELPAYGKNHVLNSRDMLRLTMEDPAKLIVSYKEGSLSVQFAGTVNGLYSGINASATGSRNDLMPRRIENRKNQQVAVIGGIILTVLVMASQIKKLI